MGRPKIFSDNNIDNSLLKRKLEKYRVSKGFTKTDLAIFLNYTSGSIISQIYKDKTRASDSFFRRLYEKTDREKEFWLSK